MNRASISVTIAVPTFRRTAMLRDLLPLLAERTGPLPESTMVRILVVDNDPEGSAAAVVRDTAATHLPVRYVHEPDPGIAAARNRAVAECPTDDVIVFIDDDEQPHPGWLAPLVDTWRRTGADAVAGRVVPRYQSPPSPWIDAGGFFVRRDLPTGTVVPTAPAGNLLLDLHTLRRHGLRFDPRTGLTGGEDTVLTQALTRLGGTVVCCRESVVEDLVPTERARPRWVLARTFSHAVSSGLMATGFPDTTSALPQRASVAARGLARIPLGAGRASLGLLTGNLRHQARGLRLLVRGAGMVVGAAGMTYVEYARDDQPGRRLRPARARPDTAASSTRPASSGLAGALGSIVSVRTDTPGLALTFDDGPDPDVTPALLDVLARHHASATFFVLTRRAQAHPDVIRRLLDEGHEIGLHGLHHRRLTVLSPAQVTADVRRAHADLTDLTGHAVPWFRPAYGAQGWRIRRLARSLSLTPVLWSATIWDWKNTDHQQRLDKAALAGPGDIVLAHDGRAGRDDGATEPADLTPLDVDKVTLLDDILTAWTDRGLRVMTVSELLRHGHPVHRLVRPVASDLPWRRSAR